MWGYSLDVSAVFLAKTGDTMFFVMIAVFISAFAIAIGASYPLIKSFNEDEPVEDEPIKEEEKEKMGFFAPFELI